MILERETLKKDKYEQNKSERGQLRKEQFSKGVQQRTNLKEDNSEEEESEKGQI